MTEWSVTAAFPAALTDSQVDTVMDGLAPYRAAIDGGAGGLEVTITVEAADVRLAAVSGLQAVIGGLAKVGVDTTGATRLLVVGAEERARELAEPSFPDLVGSSEVAEMLGVTRQRLHQLRARDDFPRPMVELAATPVWLRPAITGFIEHWPRLEGAPGHRRISSEEDAARKEKRAAMRAQADFNERHGGAGRRLHLSPAERAEQRAIDKRVGRAGWRLLELQRPEGVPFPSPFVDESEGRGTTRPPPAPEKGDGVS